MITKRRKTLLFSILFVCFILSLAVFNVRSQTAYALQGQGTETNPYIIDSTAALTEMRGLAVTQGVYFKQTQDITLSGQWTPIGTSSSPFRGNYDGDGFSINNLTITASRTDSGFFGYAGSSQNITTIKNMVFKNININFSSGNSTLYAGAVAAYVTGPVIIEGVRVESGTISMTAGTATGRFGGIIGHAAASTLTLTKSYNKAAVATNFGYAGGIVGSVVNPSNSKISVCFNEGPVTATASNQSSSSAVGGILGGVESGNGQITIEDSYNLGAVNATFTSPKATAGGIIGQSNMTASGSNKVEIITSFNAASVINTGGGGINGLVGGGTVSILSSFQYNSSFSNPYKSESEMKNGDGELGSESSNPWLGEGWYYNEGDFPTQEFFGVSPYFFITFDYNYLLSPAPVSIRTKAGETITQSAIPKPTRTVSGGGTADFVRWATANGSSTYVYNSSGNMTILVNEDLRGVTLYAEWDVRGLISVTFNYNYPANPGLSNYTYPTRASTVVSLLEHDFITEINASNPASVTSVTSTDVEFDFDNKWTSNSNGTGTEWIFDASGNLVQIIGVVEEPQVPIEEVPSILYAQWTNITQYANVTFYNAYTTPSSVAVRVAVGQNITTSNIPEPNRFGAAFNNWNTSSNGSGTAYTYSGAILSPAATALNRVTLYAQWPLTQYTLEIDDMVFPGSTFAVFNSSPSQVTVENVNATTLNITATDDSNYAFYRWQIWNADLGVWEELQIHGNPLKIADLFNQQFTFNQGFLDDYFDGTSIKFSATFYDINVNTLYTLTIKSDYQSFGYVELASGQKLEYNKIYRFLDDETIYIEAQSFDYFEFAGYSIQNTTGNTELDNPATVSANSLMLDGNTVLIVEFSKRDYSVSISYEYLDGSPTVATDLASISGYISGIGLSVQIGDEIQIACVTNRTGYKFVSLNEVLIGGNYSNLLFREGTYFIDNSGVCYLRITKELLDSCLDDKEAGVLSFAVIYLKQYVFTIDFEEQKMNQYYESLEIYATDSTDPETQSYRIDLRLGAAYHLDEGTIIIINSTFDTSVSGQVDSADLFSGIDFIITLSSDKSVTISMEADSYTVIVEAKWYEGAKELDGGNEVTGVSFGGGSELTLDFNGWLDAVSKTDAFGYEFLGWKVWSYENSRWEDLTNYTNINTKNLSAIEYSYLMAGGYIEEDEDIRIMAEYIPVYTLTLITTGSGTYRVEINGQVVNNFSSGQFQNGTTVEITVSESDYIDFSGFNLTNLNLTIEETDYILAFTLNKETMEKSVTELNHSAIIAFDFELIIASFTINEQLTDADGTMEFSTSGTLSGNNVSVTLGDVLTFTFEAGSTQVLDKWTINGLTRDELVTAGYAVYNGNVLMLNLDEDTLSWLAANGDIDVVIKTVFNPLFLAGIIAGGILVPALLVFILILTIASLKKKKKIKAAKEAGIIGAARFKTNLVEDALKDAEDN